MVIAGGNITQPFKKKAAIVNLIAFSYNSYVILIYQIGAHMNRRIRLRDIAEKPLTAFDWFAFVVIAVICFFSLQQWDILHTGGSSFGFLNA